MKQEVITENAEMFKLSWRIAAIVREVESMGGWRNAK